MASDELRDAGGEPESIDDQEIPLIDDELRVNLRRTASNATSQVALIGSNVCPIESLDFEYERLGLWYLFLLLFLLLLVFDLCLGPE